MMHNQMYSQIDFGGSLVLKDAYSIGLKENKNIKSQNVIQSGRSVKGLFGYEKYIKYALDIGGDVDNPVRSIFRFNNISNETFKTLLHVKNDIYLMDEVNSIITPTAITPGGDTFNSSDIQWAYLNGTLFFVDGALHGTTGVMKYDGTNVSGVTIANSIAPRFICTYYNRTVIAGDPDYPNRLAWSDAGDPTTIDMANNFMEVPDPGGGVIRAVVQYIDSLFVFNENSIHSMYGNQFPNALSVVSSNIGTPATKSVVVHGANIFWFGNDKHIHMFRSGQYYNLSLTDIGKLPVDADYLNKVVCWIEDDQLYVSFKHEDNPSPFNNSLFICDYTDPRNTIWCGPHANWHISCVSQYNYATDTQDVVYGDSYCSMLWKRSAADYNLGVGISTLINDASPTVTEIDIDVTTADTTRYDLDNANALTGVVFEVNGQTKTVKTSTAAAGGIVTITLRTDLDSAPADDDVVCLGRMEMIYETVQNVFKSLFIQKYFQKMYVQAKSLSGADLLVTMLHNGSATGNVNTVDMDSDQALWDTAVWDTDVWSVDDQVLNREIDLKPELEYGWQSSVQIKNEIGVNKSLEIVGLAILFESEDMVRNT